MENGGPPSAQQLNPIEDDLDGQCVVVNLLGKTVGEAAQLLAENSLRYAEDYTWMGPGAFSYYASAPLLYLNMNASDGDYDFAYSMIQRFRTRLQWDGPAVAPAIPTMREFCQRTASDFARLEFPQKYEKRLARRISELEAEINRVTGT